MNRQDVISKLEDYADQILRHGKHVLPHVARLFLLSTFIEDGFRMWFQWGAQRDYMDSLWGVGWFLGTVFVIINLLGQLIPSAMIVIRKHITIACYILFGIVILQTIAYQIFAELRFLMRNLALSGGLLLLLAETKKDGTSQAMFAGVPRIDSPRAPQNYFQLTGRVLLILMFVSLFHSNMSFIRIAIMVVESMLMFLVAVGFKTKLSALVLCTWLFVVNLYFNQFWTVPDHRALRDFLKYDFFQTCSVIGGLLMVVSLGPGGVSMDEQKKKW